MGLCKAMGATRHNRKLQLQKWIVITDWLYRESNFKVAFKNSVIFVESHAVVRHNTKRAYISWGILSRNLIFKKVCNKKNLPCRGTRHCKDCEIESKCGSFDLL